MLGNIGEQIQLIIGDILENKDISHIFLRVQVLVHSLKNDKLSHWLKSEQSGYTDDLLPEYRIIKVPIIGVVERYTDFGKILRDNHMVLPTSHITDQQIRDILTINRCKEPLNKIQNMAQEKKPLCIVLHSPAIDLLQDGLPMGYYIDQCWQELQHPTLTYIVEQVKSTLLQFLLEINKSLDLNMDLNSISNKTQIENVINNTIYAATVTVGDNSTINANQSTLVGGTGNAITISNDTKSELESIIAKIESCANDIEDGKADIMDAIFSIREELTSRNPRPKFIKTAFNSLKTVGAGVIANEITPLIGSAIAILSRL